MTWLAHFTWPRAAICDSGRTRHDRSETLVGFFLKGRRLDASSQLSPDVRTRLTTRTATPLVIEHARRDEVRLLKSMHAGTVSLVSLRMGAVYSTVTNICQLSVIPQILNSIIARIAIVMAHDHAGRSRAYKGSSDQYMDVVGPIARPLAQDQPNISFGIRGASEGPSGGEPHSPAACVDHAVQRPHPSLAANLVPWVVGYANPTFRTVFHVDSRPASNLRLPRRRANTLCRSHRIKCGHRAVTG